MSKHPNVNGGDEVRAKWRRTLAALGQDVESELVKAAETTRTEVVADIRTLKVPPGVEMQAGPGRRKHIPSPPYGPPNSDTGRLMNSYTTTLERAGATVSSRVVAGVRYARWLEFGTVIMKPRPHLLPRYRKNAERLRSRLAALASALNGRSSK